jgi:N6-adenosine-specific RNA methylase IME4
MTDQPLYRRYYKCIEADPPWAFRSFAPPNGNARSRRDVEVHYQTMNLSDIKALPIRDLAHPDGCHLFLWTTGPCLPQALETIKEWGFRYSGIAFTWVKLLKRLNGAQVELTTTAEIASLMHTGLGFTTRKNAEFCLLARRGNAKRVSKSVRELIISPRREHSRKPPEAKERIEAYCVGPYLSLFGRESRPNWTIWGDQAEKFDKVDSGDKSAANLCQLTAERNTA